VIQAGGSSTLRSEIHKVITSIWNKEELPHQGKESIIVSINKKVIKVTVVIMEVYHRCQLHTKFYSVFLSRA
jgi:hypothetical protein